ncbi:MAG TPA: efflux RND transporter permease subunit [Usitatibacter sp.]|jgi:HAE1 family hydrophobic/amphiphilic exporter-1|nr:efflux RND transporter permease subunit [Usitatibacter sp.]
MSFAQFFMRRPVATMLAWLTVVVAGFAAWTQLPIAALPTYDSPTIQVLATLLGASPETMSTAVATPLEKQFSAIPGLVATTSASIQGETRITLEFDPSRNIDAAAGDIQAALYRSTRSLPAEMTTPPSYKKINPAEAATILIGLSSPSLRLTDLNAFSDNLVIPALSTIKGVAQVMVTGQKRYAVRIEVHPDKLAALNLTLPEVSAALKAANSNAPIGELDGPRQMLMLQMSGSLMKAADFGRVVIATRQGQPVKLSDIAAVQDSIENAMNTSAVNGEEAIILYVLRQPGTNTVATVDAIRAMVPRLQAEMPASVKVQLLQDRSTSIRQAIHDVNLTLLLTIALVVMVMALFLRRLAATLIPSITLPISLLGTFGAMAAMHLSLDNISLMGLTIAVGLVVDDAIVVLENIMRHIEAGMTPYDAAVQGTREVAFTVLSISISLVAVFIPIFFMPGTIGLLFHEFAIVVTLAILVSAAVALTLIPVLLPKLIKPGATHARTGPVGRAFDAGFERALAWYARGVDWAITHRAIVLLTGAATVAITGWLYVISPKGFFPQEDTGQVSGNIDTPQDMSYEGRLAILNQLQERILHDPAVLDVASKVDHDTTAFSITLKDRRARAPMERVLTRLRANTNFIPGIKVLYSPVQNLRVGGRSSRSTFQYTLQSVKAGALDEWADKLMAAMERSGTFVGLNTDAQKNGLQARLTVDREKAAMLGVDMAALREALYTAYGTRQVSTIYAPEDSYQVIMEVSSAHRRDETDLSKIYVRGANGDMVPVAAIAGIGRGKGAMAINHQMQLPAITISFDLAPGRSLSEGASAIESATNEIAMPPSIFGSFAGTAALFQKSQTSQLWLIVIAVAAIYVILGMLYESWIHPVTILLGIPSAAVGALLALRIMGLELTFIAMIGILLLVGIVKKNAIMMIDFALEAQRDSGLDPKTAIRQACLLRFRPIMMTTLCAIMGALPIALGAGAGAELRQPLGVAIVGGLVFSQLITLFITPVLFLTFDDLARGPAGRVDCVIAPET